MVDGPLSLHRGEIRPEWIDYNGHMNVAYYVLVFDLATDAFLDYLGIDAAYRERTGYTTYALETHVTYDRELKVGDPYRVSVQLLDRDARRLHYFQRLYRDRQGDRQDDGEGDGEGFLAATTELILMHMDLASVRGIEMPDEIRARVDELMDAHARLPVPEQKGRVIGIRRRRK